MWDVTSALAIIKTAGDPGEHPRTEQREQMRMDEGGRAYITWSVIRTGEGNMGMRVLCNSWRDDRDDGSP